VIQQQIETVGIASLDKQSTLVIVQPRFDDVVVDSIAVLSFALTHLVVWPDALLMSVGALGGGYLGASMAVRIGEAWVRRGIVLIGFVIFFAMIWRLRG
jgi:uncharacterized membrane protein YfcA